MCVLTFTQCEWIITICLVIIVSKGIQGELNPIEEMPQIVKDLTQEKKSKKIYQLSNGMFPSL